MFYFSVLGNKKAFTLLMAVALLAGCTSTSSSTSTATTGNLKDGKIAGEQGANELK